MSVSRCVVWRGVKKQKPRSRSWKANRLSARRWCPSASLRDLLAAEVSGSDVLIVLWSRHGALAPRRVRLTKVKSAGSIKAPRLAAGLWEGLCLTRHLLTATDNQKVTNNLTEKTWNELWWWWFKLLREISSVLCRPFAFFRFCCYKRWTKSTSI